MGLTPLAAPGLGPYPFMGPESEASGKTMSVHGALCVEDCVVVETVGKPREPSAFLTVAQLAGARCLVSVGLSTLHALVLSCFCRMSKSLAT